MSDAPNESSHLNHPNRKAEVIDLDGTWPADCQQRAFVEGAKWCMWHVDGWTLYPEEVDQVEAEAVRRYGNPLSDQPRKTDEQLDRMIQLTKDNP